VRRPLQKRDLLVKLCSVLVGRGRQGLFDSCDCGEGGVGWFLHGRCVKGIVGGVGGREVWQLKKIDLETCRRGHADVLSTLHSIVTATSSFDGDEVWGIMPDGTTALMVAVKVVQTSPQSKPSCNVLRLPWFRTSSSLPCLILFPALSLSFCCA
jgi:hypothetical protein